MTRELPEVPRISTTLLGEHAAAHAHLDAELRAAPVTVARLLTRLAHRTMVTAIANVRPSIRGRASPPLFPIPRAFLSSTDRIRTDACAAAYRYVDSRQALVRSGLEEPPALLPEAPYVLNALAEGRMDNPDEMNPGMIRGVELEGTLPVATYRAARRTECRVQLGEAVDRARSDPAPAVVRAAWILHVLGEIHPFADGNGRVARLLYLLVTGDEMPRTVDWGVVEQLRYHQDTWSSTLKVRDVTPCAIESTELSIAGARLMSARLAAIGTILAGVEREFTLPEDSAAMVVAVWLRRLGRLQDLAADLELTYAVALAQSERLAQAGILERRRDSEQPRPARPAYAIGQKAGAGLADVVASAVNSGTRMRSIPAP